MSDIHIETLSDDLCMNKFITPVADILILAGDIGRITKYYQLKNFLTNLCSKFDIVLYVLGNHEYYRVHGKMSKNMETLLSDLYKINSNIPNLYILNRKSIIIENVCVIGCTLWSQAMVDIPSYIVRIPGMNVRKYNSLFYEDLNYIERMIKYCQTKKLKLLVVTHHCPTFSLSKNKNNDKYKSLYCSNLDYLLDKKKVHTWVYGHIHKNFDIITEKGTRLVSNQKGKPKDNITDYILDKIISV